MKIDEMLRTVCINVKNRIEWRRRDKVADDAIALVRKKADEHAHYMMMEHPDPAVRRAFFNNY